MRVSSRRVLSRSALAALVGLGLLAAPSAASAQPAQPAPPPGAPAPEAPPEFVPPSLRDFVEAVRPPGTDQVAATVTLEILVDPTGATKEVKVVASTVTGQGFEEAAVAAAQRFTWEPARAKGKAVPVRITYEYQFTVVEVAPTPVVDDQGRAAKGTARLEGEVLERGTRVALADVGVAAVNPDSGEALGETTTDAQGRFVIDGLPAGRVKVVVLLAQYRRSSYTETLAEAQAVKVRYLLEKDDYDPYQTTVRGEIEREEVERKSIDARTAQKIPGTRGDVLRAVENFPGVARPPFGGGQLVIRGSNPDDTQTYFDGHATQGIYHFGGLTSIVNSDLLKRLDFLPGNFSARYGRATGGVVAVEFREPKRERWTGYADLNFIHSGFLVEGPVGDGAIAISARRSYIDVLLSAVIPDDAGLDFTTAPVYWDYQLLYARRLGGGRFELQVFGARDALEFITESPADVDPSVRGTIGARTYTQRTQASWRRSLGADTDLLLSYSTGVDTLSFSIGQFLDLDIKQWVNSARAELTHRPSSWATLTLGLDERIVPFEVYAKGPRPPQEGESQMPNPEDERLTDETGFDNQLAVYVEAEFDLGHGFTIVPGSRVEYYSYAGEFSVDPRLTARWRSASREHTIRAGVGRYSQAPQPYENNAAFGNPEADPEHAIHYALGYDYRLGGGSVETTLFYKTLDSVVTADPQVQLDNDAIGRIYGAELLLRWSGGQRWFGWVSYTYSKSERKDGDGEDWRLFDYDQPHIITAVASVKLPWRLEAGLRYRYVSGNPETPVVGSIYDADSDTYTPIPGPSNSLRQSSFQSFDVRIERRWVFDSWMLTAYIDIQNATNRLNQEGSTYSYDYRERKDLTGLPVIPSLGIKGEF